MDLLYQSDVTISPIQKMGIRGYCSERGPSRFTRHLEGDELQDKTNRIDVEGNDRTKGQLCQYFDQVYSADFPIMSLTEVNPFGSYRSLFYEYEINKTLILQKGSLGIITIADVDKLFFQVISQFIELPEVQSIYVLDRGGEFHFYILLSTKDADEEVLFPLFDKESALHKAFSGQFFTFHYFPIGSVDRAEYIPRCAELIFGKEDV